MNERIILASKSIARRNLLKELGLEFICVKNKYEEDMNAYASPIKLAKFLALQKAKSVAKDFPGSIIIAADTFVMMGKEKIGKPKTLDEARKILRKKSNNKVSVHSGVAIIKTSKAGKISKQLTKHVLTTLNFGKITDADIEEIIKKDRVLSTSGALTIEGESGKFVKEIDGDFQNVMGLPLFEVKKMLKAIR